MSDGISLSWIKADVLQAICSGVRSWVRLNKRARTAHFRMPWNFDKFIPRIDMLFSRGWRSKKSFSETEIGFQSRHGIAVRSRIQRRIGDEGKRYTKRTLFTT